MILMAVTNVQDFNNRNETKLPTVWPARTGMVLCAVLHSDLVKGGKPTAVNSVCVVQSISKQNSERRLTLGLR